MIEHSQKLSSSEEILMLHAWKAKVRRVKSKRSLSNFEAKA
jgi:hypothetical protein